MQSHQPSNECTFNVIVVEGRGTVEVTPDIAVLQIALETDASNAAEALSAVSVRAESVLEALRAAQINDEDVQTTGMSLVPKFELGGYRVHHYQASYGLRVRLREISEGPRAIESISAAAGDALRWGAFR